MFDYSDTKKQLEIKWKKDKVCDIRQERMFKSTTSERARDREIQLKYQDIQSLILAERSHDTCYNKTTKT